MYHGSVYKIGNREFDFIKPYVMGILNVTPDSFSDGGKFFNKNDAVNHAIEMLNDRADIIDIGGESTRPGSDPVSAEEELNRVLPVIEKILEIKPDAILSIDTTKSRVARKVLESGVKIVNDISGLTFDPGIAETAAEFDAVLVLMHIKGEPKTMQANPSYKDVINEILEFLNLQTEKAVNAGVNKIFIDPGIGFGKRVEDNLEIINRLDEFNSLGYPVLIGISRKSFLGKILDVDVNERDTVTAAAEAIAIKNGARIIRTHNVKNGVNICKLFKAFKPYLISNDPS